MAEQKSIEETGKDMEKSYKNPVLFLHKSKAGGHLFAFNMEKEGGEGMVLGDGIESLLMNISDVTAVMNGEMTWCKVSIMPKKAEE